MQNFANSIRLFSITSAFAPLVLMLGTAVALGACSAADELPYQNSPNVGTGGLNNDGDDTGGSNQQGTGGSENISADPLRVLFMGNSFTFYNDLDVWVHNIAAAGTRVINTERLTTSGVSLEWHWMNDAQEVISDGWNSATPWSHVVLQGYSNEPLTSDGSAAGASSSFQMHATLLADAVRAVGATPVFFETWAYAECNADYPTLWGGNSEAMQDGLLAGYTAAALRNNAWLALVGEGWRIIQLDHPEIAPMQMYDTDCKHPASWGTYLTACVFYVRLTGQAVPANAPAPANMPADVVATLHAVAAQVGMP